MTSDEKTFSDTPSDNPWLTEKDWRHIIDRIPEFERRRLYFGEFRTSDKETDRRGLSSPPTTQFDTDHPPLSTRLAPRRIGTTYRRRSWATPPTYGEWITHSKISRHSSPYHGKRGLRRLCAYGRTALRAIRRGFARIRLY